MITDTARSHGSLLILLLDQLDKPISIERLEYLGTGYYLIEQRIPVYLKMSSKRKGPWTFNFIRSHQENQEALYQKYGECFTCLICGRDGIAGLSMSELRQVLDGDFEEQECISVRRKLKAMYSIKGRDGELNNRVGRRSIFDKLQDAISQGTTTA
ncbi:MAG: hypothetical protein JKY49_13060 [Cohaesibacteraceae bacterium]|nr:hypothetical protein [Cohaesibacteraceae bacterium]PCH82120.1 MAG: hypothetical protein COB90_01585 [Hyphomicrobiales bacterium]